MPTPANAATKLLLHFDEASGSTSFVDNTSSYIFTTQATPPSHISTINVNSTFANVGSFNNNGLIRTPIQPNSVYLASNTANNFSIELWFYPTQVNIQQILYAYASNTASNINPRGPRLYLNTLSLNWQGLGDWTNCPNINASNNAVANAWNHTAMVFDSANSMMKMYLNGKLEANANISSTPCFNPTDAANCVIMIGGDMLSSVQSTYFKGYIDEFRFVYGATDPTYTGFTYTLPSVPFALISVTGGPGQMRIDGSGTNFGVVGNVGDIIVFNTSDSSRKLQSKTIVQVVTPSICVVESNTTFFHTYLARVTNTSNVITATNVLGNIAVNDIISLNVAGNAQTAIIQVVTQNTLSVNTVFQANASNLVLVVYPSINAASYAIVQPPK